MIMLSLATTRRTVLGLVVKQHHSRRQLSSSMLRATPSTSFDDGTSPIQITTPIYYVNDKPHIGHAYTSTGTSDVVVVWFLSWVSSC